MVRPGKEAVGQGPSSAAADDDAESDITAQDVRFLNGVNRQLRRHPLQRIAFTPPPARVLGQTLASAERLFAPPSVPSLTYACAQVMKATIRTACARGASCPARSHRA